MINTTSVTNDNYLSLVAAQSMLFFAVKSIIDTVNLKRNQFDFAYFEESNKYNQCDFRH